ncbi:hypothetical protein YC2023_102775 [Brassica napus]
MQHGIQTCTIIYLIYTAKGHIVFNCRHELDKSKGIHMQQKIRLYYITLSNSLLKSLYVTVKQFRKYLPTQRTITPFVQICNILQNIVFSQKIILEWYNATKLNLPPLVPLRFPLKSGRLRHLPPPSVPKIDRIFNYCAKELLNGEVLGSNNVKRINNLPVDVEAVPPTVRS